MIVDWRVWQERNSIMESINENKHEQQAKAYGWLAEVFWNAPTQGLLAVFPGEVFYVGEEGSCGKMVAYLEKLTPGELENIAVDYTSLFAGCRQNSPYPYESVFTGREGRIMMQEARDQVVEVYNENGYVINVSGENNEPEDHVSHELRFLAHLHARAAKADIAQAATEKAIDTFKQSHLVMWVPDFCREVEEQADTKFYQLSSKLLRESLCLDKC